MGNVALSILYGKNKVRVEIKKRPHFFRVHKEKANAALGDLVLNHRKIFNICPSNGPTSSDLVKFEVKKENGYYIVSIANHLNITPVSAESLEAAVGEIVSHHGDLFGIEYIEHINVNE